MTSTETFNAAFALFEQAHREAVAEQAGAEVRMAKLRAVLALEQAGKNEEAAVLLAEVRAEQEMPEPCGAEFGNPELPCELSAGHEDWHQRSTVTWCYDTRDAEQPSEEVELPA